MVDSVLRFAFELRNRGFDNDQHENWDRSCNIYGSPGDEPLKNCIDICSTILCQANVPPQWKDYGCYSIGYDSTAGMGVIFISTKSAPIHQSP